MVDSENEYKNHFDKISKDYKTTSEEQNAELYSELAKIINPNAINKIILDVGNGGFSPYDMDQTKSITAVDLSEEMLKNIVHPKVKTVVDDARSLTNIEDESMDVVFLIFCVHHINGRTYADAIDSLRCVINAAHKKLKTDGKLIIAEPILYPFWYLIEKFMYRITHKILSLLGRDMVFFHNQKNILDGYKTVMGSNIVVTTKCLELTQSIDPLSGTFPGLITIPVKWSPTSWIYFEATKE